MNIDLDKIRVWQQYKKSSIVLDYFKNFYKYIETNYRDLFYKYNVNGNIQIGSWLENLSIVESTSFEYLNFYINNVYNFAPPLIVSNIFYDSGLKYDNGFFYDSSGDVTLIPSIIYIKLFKFIFGLENDTFSLPLLNEMLADFFECSTTEITLVKDPVILLGYIIKAPATLFAQYFQKLYSSYRNIFNLPVGFIFNFDLQAIEINKK